jgi:hypothetical protein
LIIKLIDRDIEGDNCFDIPSQKTPEDYEKNTPDFSTFFSDISDEILFILSGEAEVANCSLRILQQIKHKKITIVYLIPQRDFLTTKQNMQERVIRNVLQEYTRSGLLQRMILLDSTLIETVMGETSIKDFDSQFSGTILSLLRTYRNLETLEPMIDNSNKPKDISRLTTFAYYDFVNDHERCVYNMDLIDDKIYHFFFTEKTLNSNAKMLREIKEKLKNKAVDNTKISFTINSGAEKADFCFVTYHSKAIQQ